MLPDQSHHLNLVQPASTADPITETAAAVLPFPAPAGTAHAHSRNFVFNGTGKEYFRIWIVNLCLTIATAGIYSAWAKVRRLQYFHRNTALEGKRRPSTV
jgi:hypothetical protein